MENLILNILNQSPVGILILIIALLLTVNWKLIGRTTKNEIDLLKKEMELNKSEVQKELQKEIKEEIRAINNNIDQLKEEIRTQKSIFEFLHKKNN